MSYIDEGMCKMRYERKVLRCTVGYGVSKKLIDSKYYESVLMWLIDIDLYFNYETSI